MIGRWTTPPRQVSLLALAAPTRAGRGSGLREEIISAAVQMLGDLADDEALSLRAVCTCGVDIPHVCLPVLSRS